MRLRVMRCVCSIQARGAPVGGRRGDNNSGLWLLPDGLVAMADKFCLREDCCRAYCGAFALFCHPQWPELRRSATRPHFVQVRQFATTVVNVNCMIVLYMYPQRYPI